MSTIKSDSEDLTLNAHGSGNDILFQSNGSQVGSLTAEGVMTTTTFAGSGASLTALNATQLTSGTVPTARLGSGTASSGTILYGDQTYKAAPTSFDPDGAQVFNESGAAVDFRVESDGNANMIQVDGTNNRVGIGVASPGVQLANIGGTGTNIGAGGIYWNNSEASKYVAQFRNGSDPGWGISVKLGMSAPDATDKYIDFIDDQGSIQASFTGLGHATGGLGFQTNGSQQMAIDYEGSTTWGTWGYSNNCVYMNVGNKRSINMGVDTTSSAVRIKFYNANGNVGGIYTSGSGTSFNTSSDYRLKENVNYTWDATTRLKQLKPARFNFKTDASTTMEGFLAHEVSSIIPEAVSGDKDAMKEILYTADDVETQGESPTKAVGDFKEFHSTEIDPQGIDQSKLVPLLVKTIQELEARITALE